MQNLLPTKFFFLLFTIAILTFSSTSGLAQIYVDADATGANDGSSWTNAYTSLQDAIDAATGSDQIWIADGIYYPDEGANVTNDDRLSAFTITGEKDGLMIHGGFSGSESLLSERDLSANETILSGDIDQDGDLAGNSYNVVRLKRMISNNPPVVNFSYVWTNLSVDFTQEATDTDGSIVSYSWDFGDGSSSSSANPSHTYSSGGSYTVTLTVTDDDGATGDLSGTVTVSSGSTGNYKYLAYKTASNASNAESITNATVLSDLTIQGGNANGTNTNYYENRGAGIYCNGEESTCNPTLNRLFVTGNSATFGGGMFNYGRLGEASPTMTGVVFTANKSLSNGGAIYNYGRGGIANPKIINSTFAGNNANTSGGAMYNYGYTNGTATPEITNSIFFGNLADSDGNDTGTGDQIAVDGDDAGPIIEYSLFEGGCPPGADCGDGSTLLTANPQFSDINDADGIDNVFGTADDGLILLSNSPAIDAGTADTTGLGLPSSDLIGSPRIEGSGINLGAYEVLTPVNGGGAITLDGIDDYLVFDDVANSYSGLVPFSVEFWMKADINDQEDTGAIALLDIRGSDKANDIIVMMSGDGKPQMYLNDAFQTPIEYQIGDNEWHHIHLNQFVNSSDQSLIQLFVDGDYKRTYSTGYSFSTGDLISIGQEFDGSSTTDHLKGSIDNVRFLKEDLVVADTIKTTVFQPMDPSDEDVVALFRLNENSGSTLYDEVSGTNLGTTMGNPVWSEDRYPTGTFLKNRERWKMVSNPTTGSTYGEILEDFWTQGIPGSDAPNNGSPSVLYYDEATGQFSAISSMDDETESGKGFIFFEYGDRDYDGTVETGSRFITSEKPRIFGPVRPAITYTDSGTPADDGWNLVGNPYDQTIDWDAADGWSTTNLDASIYIWNSAQKTYQSWNGTTGTTNDGLIAPWQGFWVKANAANPAITFREDIRSFGGLFRKEKATPQLRFTISDGRMSNDAVVMFSEESMIEKDRLDAYKLASFNREYLSLFTELKDGSALDINALPSELEESISIPMGLSKGGSTSSGELELSWESEALPENWEFVLRDNETGQEVDLNEQSTISFQLAAGKSVKKQDLALPRHEVLSPKVMKAKGATSRFTINITSAQTVANERSADLPTTVELQQNYPNPFNPITSIEYGVPETAEVTLEVFNVLGRKVATLIHRKNKQAGRYTVQFNASDLSSGLYLYRLKTGNTVITKKLTLIK
ncbi:PKD domain-containing protein [Gracilimonas tropica]|uniref:PKD domain-containing protein n=1 Tax=Gracilimonas tropica TaxID=454600 RepID=UPI00038122C4|nr:PKD domain-containing protein [Gracilimonas tropica]